MGSKILADANIERFLSQASRENRRLNIAQELRQISSNHLSSYLMGAGVNVSKGTVTYEERGRINGGVCRGQAKRIYDEGDVGLCNFATDYSAGILDREMILDALKNLESWDTQRVIRFAAALARAAELCRWDTGKFKDVGREFEVAALVLAAMELCPAEHLPFGGEFGDIFNDESLVLDIIRRAKSFVPDRRLEISSEPYKGEELQKILHSWGYPGLVAYIACQRMWDPPRIDCLPPPEAQKSLHLS